MSEVLLSAKGLSKRFGKVQALDNLDLEVREGEVFGLLGPNGSGKTTTLGIVLGVTKANAGNYAWFGKKDDFRVRREIGAILESPSFYPYLTGRQNLEVVSAIKNVVPSRIDEVLEEVGLLERANDKFRHYSLGMKQRLAIAAALLPDPKILILDEPTNGLDPQGIADIRDLIIALAKQGRTIILASHLLAEVQKVCTEFAVLNKGKLLYQGAVNELSGKHVILDVNSSDREKLLQEILTSSNVDSHEESANAIRVVLKLGVSIEEFHKELIAEGVVLDSLNLVKSDLEDRFLRILNNEK